jgi:hypothetical protein
MNLIKMAILFAVFYKVTDYIYNKSLKEPINKSDKLAVTLRTTTNYKLKLARIFFIFGFFFSLLLIICKLISLYS